MAHLLPRRQGAAAERKSASTMKSVAVKQQQLLNRRVFLAKKDISVIRDRVTSSKKRSHFLWKKKRINKSYKCKLKKKWDKLLSVSVLKK